MYSLVLFYILKINFWILSADTDYSPPVSQTPGAREQQRWQDKRRALSSRGLHAEALARQSDMVGFLIHFEVRKQTNLLAMWMLDRESRMLLRPRACHMEGWVCHHRAQGTGWACCGEGQLRFAPDRSEMSISDVTLAAGGTTWEIVREETNGHKDTLR